jgi:hypothetical protein
MPVSAANSVRSIDGYGNGNVSSGGGLQPIGDGRFKVAGREYEAKFAANEGLSCFRGTIRVSENAVLSVPHYAGTHEGYIDITADAGTLVLQYRGDVNRYAGKGDWWVVRGAGACAEVTGSGDYTSEFSTEPDSKYKLELRGRVTLND